MKKKKKIQVLKYIAFTDNFIKIFGIPNIS